MSRHKYFDRILGRIDDLAADNIAPFVQRLARERALFETIFNTVKEGILVVDRAGDIAYANAAAARLVGLNTASEAPVSLWKLAPGLYESLGRALETWNADSPAALSRQIEVEYPEPRSLRLYVVPFAPDNPLEGRFAIILSDITQEVRTTDARIESERADSIVRLAAGVAHEIGNPLNSIGIHLQLLRRRLAALGVDEDEKAPLEKSLGVCAEEVKRLDGIVRNFLGAVRADKPDFTETDLLALLRETLELLAPELKDRGLTALIEQGEPLPPVWADKAQIKQVFFNLIKNAMQAMQPGGELRIRALSDDNFAYLHLADTGCGISPENLSRVFRPYFTTKRDGHGLGMMIVGRILRAHGAHIGIDSREGRGTVVTLRFPRKARKIRLLE